ncbi:hypothetical protein BDN71DRAFT_1508440 [Pleurotus eryngii]|uniref:Uncharacterized protein n=1 Tax=Pleurotus eryngii TaxID=5323 RepID=A0A9P5ZVV9_PLEER|nr:hypothetical protein BDN71DRAFT_1508440 [Pleurotus eryngii]
MSTHLWTIHTRACTTSSEPSSWVVPRTTSVINFVIAHRLILVTVTNQIQIARPPDRAFTRAQTFDVAALNVTYGDHYNGAIHNDTPPPPLAFAVGGATLGLAFGVAGIAAVFMLLRH